MRPFGEFMRDIVQATRDEWVREYAHVRNMRREFGPRVDYQRRLIEARKIALRNAAELRDMK